MLIDTIMLIYTYMIIEIKYTTILAISIYLNFARIFILDKVLILL